MAQHTPALAIAAAVMVAAQIIGLFGLSAAVGATGVLIKDGPGASCAAADMPPEVPLDDIEMRRFDSGWSWAPPGLTCRTEIDGRIAVVREPAWAEVAGPLLVLFGGITVTAAAFGAAVRAAGARWSRRPLPILAGVLIGALAQPVALLTAAAAYLLPGAV
ncbi:hypothetical protein CLV63_11387 [Murinocardiopsis flavida]|uniref:Uncharacterized protein n=1 Tax=Murinocardiopsis flavida TaxID=645275 RepID=A0A2P8DFD0_9ACTN|nr:hypothetical protein [Murinocardiopsis flavida]PSK95924.1 hypothetical protein CLV63_11387 [Murinocardiopsis flavida]